MGCCSSTQSQPPAGRGAFPAPLPPPMQDNMNELLNRWRHGEVNLLQRRFRLARAQSVKPTIAAKLLGGFAPPSASATTSTLAATSTTTTNNDNLGGTSFGDDGSTSPASGEDASVGGGEQRKSAGEGAIVGGLRGGAGSVETGESGGGTVGGGSSRAGMDKEAYLRVFPDVQTLPADIQKSAFRLFDCVGRGALDFRNFCRALALCCRGSRLERLRFLFDLFSGASQAKHYGTGADGGPRDAPPTSSGGSSACISEAELTVLKKHLGLSPADADHQSFQAQAVSSNADGRPSWKGLQLLEYFDWAEAHVSDEALDKALRPFYLLPSPQQEKDKVLTHLVEHHMQEGQWMCLVAAPWWAYWCSYAGLTLEDFERVPERRALGLGKERVSTAKGVIPWAIEEASPQKVVNGKADRGGVYGVASGNSGGNGHGREVGGIDDTQRRSKEREVPAVLARRPHEMDNSSLQGGAEWEVAPNQELGLDYILLPKLVWDIMVDWYGGGPVFCRQVVRVSTTISFLDLPQRAKGASPTTDAVAPAGSLTVDLYPLALHVNLCDSSGRPGGRERLVLTSHHATVGDMLTEMLTSPRLHGLRRGITSVGGDPNADQHENTVANGEAAGSVNRSDESEPDKNRDGDQTAVVVSTADRGGDEEIGDSRLWVLELSPNGLTDTPRTQTLASTPGVYRPRFSFVGGGMMGGMDAQTGVNRWNLVKPEEEHMTLSELGLFGGEKVMVETKMHDATWPRQRYVEEPGFRQFREGARVDAMDYQGRWFRGQVVEIQLKSSPRIIDSEGPVGRKSKNRRPSRSLLSAEEMALAGTIQEDDTGYSAVVAGAADADVAAGGKAAQTKSGSGSAGDGPGGRKAGEAGSVSRKRMRVRVHFDRFAPQWDEWYDSKSLKLAPEASHTAPVVPTPEVLKPREDGGGDTEGEEDVSPHAPSVKSGAPSAASSSSSRPGNGAFPPPVGRFPGENRQANGHGNSQQPRAPDYSAPRSQGTGTSTNADGVSNYGNGALNRRSNTPGRPPVAGACGLVNLGNTCYLNSAVQCLSHTPLVRAYLLSDMWVAEVNKYNPLGTQGKLVEDFAQLLKSLWSQEFLCVFPRKFRQGLVKYKPQFSGNEQQDSQEFLAEMLDALHEDVNRVIDKPYVPAPQDDEAESGRSDQTLADEAWDRHVQRNRSVIVDLFQGQLKMECRCPVCNKKSVTFDPFMYLSVPIPIRNEKMVAVILLPRIRTRDIVGSRGRRGDETGSIVTAGDGDDGEAMEFSNPRQLVPVRYGMMLPRLGEVYDLKHQLSSLSGLAQESLVVSLMLQHTVRVLDDKEPLTSVRDDDFILAFAMQIARPTAERAQGIEQRRSTTNGTRHPDPESATGFGDDRRTSKVATEVRLAGDYGVGAVSERTEGMLPNPGETPTGSANDGEANGGGSGNEDEEDTDLDDDRPPTSTVDRRSPDERCMSSFPSKLTEFEVGWRLDALDRQGGWFAGTVVEIDTQGRRRREDKPSTSKSSPSSDLMNPRRLELLLKIHFDDFTSKWDEYYGEQEWRENKLARLYSKTRPAERLLEIPVVHCRTHRAAAASARSSSRDGYELTHEGDGSVRSVRESPSQTAGGHVKEKHLFGLPFHVQCPPGSSARYLWRQVVQQASRFVAGSSGGRGFKAGMSKDKMAKAAAGASKRPHVTAAWVARAAVGLENGVTDDKLAELLPFTIKIVLRQNPLLDMGAMELKPDRWRAVSSLLCSKLILALEWKDGGRDYLDVLLSTFDHPSFLELENNAQSVLSGLTLEQCLDAYTREETLEEEDSWYCSTCQVHRRGIMKIDLWKMPDVLVIHIKRFQCSARWREKIRTVVLFPHSGLDMSGFVSSNSAHRNQAGGGQGGMVYDLYGVVNHMGGMTGGHYTACCRSSPCSKDGVEEITGWGLEHPWLNFDDEFVEEMAPDKIVSEAAYVLFYRRRRLTPSNVINMTI